MSLLWVLAALLGAFYLLVPLVVKASYHQKAVPPLENTTLEAIPPDGKAYVLAVQEALKAQGFGDPIYKQLLDYMPNVKSYFAVMIEPGSGAAVAVCAMYQIVKEQAKLIPITEFLFYFSDESSMCTNNIAITDTIPQPANKRVERFPMVSDASRLFLLHKKRLQTTPGLPTVKRLTQVMDADRLLYDSFIKFGEHLEAIGYARLNTLDNTYRLTLKGAYLATWKNLWPLTALSRARMYRRAKKLLKELEG